MIGNEIVVTSPHGRKIEGIIAGTPKPGTMMQVKAAVAPIGGRFTYEVFGTTSVGGDGAPRELLILDIDAGQGFTYDSAYQDGKRGFLWAPLPGDELNVRKADISGTSSATEDLAIGQRLLIVDGTGKISPVAVGVIASPVVYPFVCLETLVDQPAETLVWCRVSMF